MIENKFNLEEKYFNFTFVSENYTKIHSRMGFENETIIKKDIMYNCGDSFSYNADDFFVGPNHGIQFNTDN